MYMALPKKVKQPIKINIRQYIDNPYRGSSFLASRKMIKQGLNVSFIKILQRFRTQFFAVPYVYDNGDVLFHVRVPSEEHDVNKLYYDVLFYIENDPSKRYSMRDIKMFSNSPSFVFTYAYVYYHDDLMIDKFADKLPMLALTKPPEIRNPVESLGYEKSTYIAARYLLDGFCLTDDYINKYKKKMTPLEEMNLSVAIADAEKIVQIYALGQELQAKTRRKAVDEKRRSARMKMRQSFANNAKRTKPKTTGIIFKKTPRAKITARKAVRSLMND
jgi:hypothetical protein